MHPEHLEQIKQWGLEKLPHEACGVIIELPGESVIRQLGNYADDPTKGYKVDNTELVEVLAEVIESSGHGVLRDQVVVWHTHPSGHIGPSTEDLASKVSDLRYLVVSLPNGEATQF